uniref:polymorphic toxin-type HINT domain-containing protein n=1 Tax=Streptomyces sp. CHD11 TaxID=2741325 RepID=UPI0027E45B7D|nr:polymorphic toxin-type HINT domain-containing protein [Streptomyces sp. CHD11]
MAAALKRKSADNSGCLTGKKHSFLPGTKVLLANGKTKPIEKVTLGDKIIVTDPVTGKTVVRQVVGTIVTEDDKHFVDLTVKSTSGKPEKLVSTTTHPFWSDSEQAWIEAGDLNPGMRLHTTNGETVELAAVHTFNKRQRTHDLTVESVHTYYVLAGETPVLVHNCNGRDPVNGGLDDDTYDRIDGAHGPDVADGVDYQVQRMHDGSSTAADHDLPGIGHDPDALASYFASWRGKMTHTDTRTGSRVAYDSSRGVLLVTTGRNIHGFRYSQGAFESGRCVTP